MKQPFNFAYMEFKLVHNYNSPRQPDNVKLPVKIRCYFARKYQYVDTGVFVESLLWDGTKVINKHPQAAAANLSIKNKLNELENTCYDYERSGGKFFDFNALNHFLTGHKDSIFFLDYIESCFKNEIKSDYKTLNKYRSNLKQLRLLISDKPISEYTHLDIESIDRILRSKYADSTVSRFNVYLQKYFKKALKEGLISADPFIKAELNKFRGEGKKVFLTFDEISKIENVQGLTKSQLMIRDRFLYSCYTGLRISDNLELRKNMITDTDDGLIVSLRTIKGYGHDLIHPLRLLFDGKPEKIARYWISEHKADTLFPVVSRMYISEILKIIADAASIDKHLTFHVARHTCATMLAEITQNPYLMLNIMGWQDLRIAMNYIHASTESVKRQLKIYNGKW